MKPGDLAGVIPMGSIMWDVELEQAMVEHGRPRVEAAFRKDIEASPDPKAKIA